MRSTVSLVLVMAMLIHPATQYALDVVSGQRVAGVAERQACQRHLDDLQCQGSDNFPWIFDESKAARIYTWFNFCKHVEGPLAGQPIQLEAFQQFDLGVVFGWVHATTGLRRFEKAYVQEARKNGKSTLMSGVALYLMAGDKEESPAVFCAAVDKEQARIIYRSAKSMAQKSPDIRKRLKIRDYEIGHISRGGQMRALSKDTKNKDGLNPSGAIIDEYHAHPTSEIYDLIWSAWGQRAQALMMIITTAGLDVENSPCYREYVYCKQILQGLLSNDRYFVMIRELDPDDDEHNPAVWIKANPLRAASPAGVVRIQAQHDEAFSSHDPAKVRTFRVKNLNIWVNERPGGYLGDYIQAFDKLAVSRDAFISLTRGRPCLVGVDLSKKIDLTANAFVFLLDDGRIAVTAHGFMPETGIARHEKSDRIPYQDWGRDGWLTVTPGDVTDYSFIKSHILDCEGDHGWQVKEIAFDPYNATHFANDLQADGYTCVEIRQGVRTLSEPTKLLREHIAQGKLVHDGSPLLRWCLANAVVEQDSNENIKLSKRTATDTQRIDLASAMINALARLAVLKGYQDISNDILNEGWGM
jgi:phage terminase large subunit-like protein